MKNDDENKVNSHKPYGYGHKQIRNNLQKIISKSAKHLNADYVKAVNVNSHKPEKIKLEYLQQKVLKLAERKMSRSNYSSLLDQVFKLDENQKKPFLQQLFKQLNDFTR